MLDQFLLKRFNKKKGSYILIEDKGQSSYMTQLRPKGVSCTNKECFYQNQATKVSQLRNQMIPYSETLSQTGSSAELKSKSFEEIQRFFRTLMGVLSILDREDLTVIYELVMEEYKDRLPEGFDRMLWGDMMIMFNQGDTADFGYTARLEAYQLENYTVPLRGFRADSSCETTVRKNLKDSNDDDTVTSTHEDEERLTMDMHLSGGQRTDYPELMDLNGGSLDGVFVDNAFVNLVAKFLVLSVATPLRTTDFTGSSRAATRYGYVKISQEISQKRTRERMSDQEAKEIKSRSQRNHASAFYSLLQLTTFIQSPAPLLLWYQEGVLELRVSISWKAKDFSLHDDGDLSLSDDASLWLDLYQNQQRIMRFGKVILEWKLAEAFTKARMVFPGLLPSIHKADRVLIVKEKGKQEHYAKAVPKDNLRRFHGMDDATKNLDSYQDLGLVNAKLKENAKKLFLKQTVVSDEMQYHKFLRSLPPAWHTNMYSGLAYGSFPFLSSTNADDVDLLLEDLDHIDVWILECGILIREKVACFNCHNTGHFAWEWKFKGTIDGSRQEASRVLGSLENVSKCKFTVLLNCKSHDSDGEHGNGIDHSVNVDYLPELIKTGRVNVNTGKQNVSSGRLNVSSGTHIKSGSSRVNTGKQHVNSGSMYVNSVTTHRSGSSRINTGKQNANPGPKNGVQNKDHLKIDPLPRLPAIVKIYNAVKGQKLGTDGPHGRTKPMKGLEVIVDSGCSGHMTGIRAHLRFSKNSRKWDLLLLEESKGVSVDPFRGVGLLLTDSSCPTTLLGEKQVNTACYFLQQAARILNLNATKEESLLKESHLLLNIQNFVYDIMVFRTELDALAIEALRTCRGFPDDNEDVMPESGIMINSSEAGVKLCKKKLSAVSSFIKYGFLVDLPTVLSIDSYQVFLSFAHLWGSCLSKLDVKSAFLYGTIDEEVYVSQLSGFVILVFSIKKHGYKRGTIDKTLFIRRNKKDIMLVQVYVDDIIFGSTNKSWCAEFEALMQSRFQMSSMGELTFFLGLQVKAGNKEGIFISMGQYVFCSRFQGFTFDLEAFSDSDYGGSNLDRKSTTGGCQFLGQRLISWQCKKQTIVATSTTEAEYVAAAHCCGQVLWVQNQLLDYGFNFMNTKIHIDNESTICIVKNPVYHSKTKHIEIRHHFIRDCYEKKLISVEKIHTDLNVADLLTKPFDGPRYYLVLKTVKEDQLGHGKESARCHSLIGCNLVVSNDDAVYLLSTQTKCEFHTPSQVLYQLSHYYATNTTTPPLTSSVTTSSTSREQPKDITAPTQPVKQHQPPPVLAFRRFNNLSHHLSNTITFFFHDTECPSLKPSYHLSPPPSHEPEIQAFFIYKLGAIEKVIKAENKQVDEEKEKLETKMQRISIKKFLFESDQVLHLLTLKESKGFRGGSRRTKLSPFLFRGWTDLIIVASEGFKGSKAPLGSKTQVELADLEEAKRVQAEMDVETQRQIDLDALLARRLVEQEEEAAREALATEFDYIQARLNADQILAEKIQQEEREQYSIEERSQRMLWGDMLICFIQGDNAGLLGIHRQAGSLSAGNTQLHRGTYYHESTGLVFNMLVESRFPLTKGRVLFQQMLELNISNDDDTVPSYHEDEKGPTDKILTPIPDSFPCCARCGTPVDGPSCRGCAFLRKKFDEDLLAYCVKNGIFKDFQNTSESSDNNTNVVNALREPCVVNQDPGEKSSQEPPQIDHNCCYECGDSLDGIFCRQCICKSCGKGAHYGYNCPPKVPIISNQCNQTINEPPQILPIVHPTCNYEAKNSFTYDPNPNFFYNSPKFSYPPPQPQFETYLCELCGNNAHYGYDCPPQFPFVYEQEPCYNQNFSDNYYLQNSPSFSQQYLCCAYCGVSIEEMRHEQQLVDRKIKEITNDLGIRRFRGEEIDEEYERDCEIRIRKLKQDFNVWGSEVRKKEKAYEDEKYAAACRYMLSVTCDDEDDYIPLAITTDLPIEEPDNSLNMGDEHLDTIPATESDEVIKSSVENLVPIPSEFEGISDDSCDVPICDIGRINVESDFVESLINCDTSIFHSSKIDPILEEFAGELAHIAPIPPGIVEADFDPNDDTSSDDDDFEDIEYINLEEVELR
ncbi:putative ribonuclease H-like domain-containing protein [Tanacetum coccineum]